MTLAVCASPIGNLEDVTLRVLRELREADVVLCEDTRRTQILLRRHGIRARLVSYHEHNEAARTAEMLPRLRAGERVALVSDAGLPAISDPGARLVRAALDEGVTVTVLPARARARDTAIWRRSRPVMPRPRRRARPSGRPRTRIAWWISRAKVTRRRSRSSPVSAATSAPESRRS